jgi:hypothetical protein
MKEWLSFFKRVCVANTGSYNVPSFWFSEFPMSLVYTSSLLRTIESYISYLAFVGSQKYSVLLTFEKSGMHTFRCHKLQVYAYPSLGLSA